MRFRNLRAISDGGVGHWVAVKPSLVSSRSRSKFKYNINQAVVKQCCRVLVVMGDVMAPTGSAL